MKVGILFSGGKDSCLAYHKARVSHDAACLISLVSKNKESYMFHVPNIEITKLQAKAIGLPLIQKVTKGEKEKELEDLRAAIYLSEREFNIEGIVTGAIMSIYQASRVQKICQELDLWCFNPLWLKDQVKLLEEVLETGLSTIISGVFAYPLDKKYLGKMIDRSIVEELALLREKYGLNPAGEGGEIETTVLDAPFFRKRIEISDYNIFYSNYSGTFEINKARLVEK